ncbi:hypothetical protein [Hydrogenophaga pseudoflava]|uniref:hypothetical protein n=1 Tax=Hydrogenophaga pseudoflava TaxID=47421 RepID=UPI0027E425CA|nr:hypothetical protein [Hydrogenophaga pseudoflava]MDQ7743815.1 hypothetical protein [Hydrogenophaga pseudoflava]
MGTSNVRQLNDEEMARLPLARAAMEEAGKYGTSSRFNFFAAFDGTNNDQGNLELSGDPYPTNIGNLDKQANRSVSGTFRRNYYPGVGTGGDQGNAINAGPNPTPAIDAAAEKAYRDFSDAAQTYLRDHPGATPADLGASVTGFSRGCAAAVRFSQLVNDRGLVAPDGTVVAPPGSIPITGMALMDPVATGVKGELGLPPNVRGQVLVVQAEHESRSWFRPLDYSDDPRVTTVKHPGNHVGVGGGYDRQGTAANVHEGVTAYFQRRGVPLADVPAEQRHNPGQRAMIRTENYQTARNGDVLEYEDGRKQLRWPLDDDTRPRITVKPRISEQTKAHLRHSYTELAPGLKARGLDSGQCLQVSAACLAKAAEHPDWGDPKRYLLSRNGEQVAVQHQNGRFDEVRVDEALRSSANVHLDRAQALQQSPGTPAAQPERAAPVQAEPALAR